MFSSLVIVILIAAALAFATTKIPVAGNFFQHYTTLIHEMGHASVAGFFGGRVKGIKLRLDTSGETASAWQRGSTLSQIMSAISGYPAPVLFAALMVLPVIINEAHIAWWAMLVLSIFTILLARSVFTLFSAVMFAVFPILFLFLYPDAPASLQTFVISFIAAIVLFNGVKDLGYMAKVAWVTKSDHTDAAILSEFTIFGERFWSTVIVLNTIIVSAVGVLSIVKHEDIANFVQSVIDSITQIF